MFYFKNLKEVYIQSLQEVWLNKQGELQIGDFISSVVLYVHLQAENWTKRNWFENKYMCA